MDASSPLAAIRPSNHLFTERGIFGFGSPEQQPRTFRGVRFNLGKQLGINNGIKASRKAMFDDALLRGSSPSMGLAFDFSQNLGLDQDNSPKFATPRRALFTANNMSGLESMAYIAGPPLLDSSPTPHGMDEMMDISPLPHKVPVPAISETVVDTSMASVEGDEEVSPTDTSFSPQPAIVEPPKPTAVNERRLVVPRRPSLSRTKAHSANLAPTFGGRAQAESQLPPFRFGADSRFGFSNTSSTLSPSECFQESPLQERRPQSANTNSPTPGAIRPRTQFSSLSSASGIPRSGSPIQGHSRRTSNPFMRPRKQYRRSLSMFESSGEMMKPKKVEPPPAPTLAAVMDMEEPHEPVLPHFFAEGQNDSIPRIKRSTLLEVLDGRFDDQFDNKMVIDCRFEYEYEGGHINGAVNYNDKDLLVTELLRNPREGRTVIIFHCEYSAHRAPLMAQNVRSEDRALNAEFYPRLTYPEIYILEGGYSGFFHEHRDRCYPQAYVEMDAAEHVNTCEREMGRLRQNRKGPLLRAQTFAFGQELRAASVMDSPTAPGRCPAPAFGRSPLEPESPFSFSPIDLARDRGHARRMASY